VKYKNISKAEKKQDCLLSHTALARSMLERGKELQEKGIT
jgi:hypothetical protein